MRSYSLKIITPDRVLYDGEVERIIVRTIDGDMAIMRGHIPLVGIVDISTVKLTIDGKEKKAAISSGYIEVRKNETLLMVEAAEWPDEIDIERAQRARKRAEKRLRERESKADISKEEMALRRAINRIEVSKDH